MSFRPRPPKRRTRNPDGCVVHIVVTDSIAITVTLSPDAAPATDRPGDRATPQPATPAREDDSDPLVIFDRPSLDRRPRQSNSADLADYAPSATTGRPDPASGPVHARPQPSGPASPADGTEYARQHLDERNAARRRRTTAIALTGVGAVLATATPRTTHQEPVKGQLAATTVPASVPICYLDSWFVADSGLAQPSIPAYC
jgi:hypothetical protein